MQPEIRKIVTVTETLLSEGGRPLEQPIRLVAVGAVIRNPLVGQPFTEDLSAFVDAFGPPLGELLGPQVVDLLDGRVEAYGKGALVGADGEIEHGSAIIHTLKFGDKFREPAGGTTLLPAAEKRGGVGASLDLALKHKNDHAIRSHHITFEVRVPDAPRADEIVVFCTATDGGRPHARIGAGPQDDG
jgi:hypothetical protein